MNCLNCGHAFGIHFITFNGQAVGCTATNVGKNVVSGKVWVKACECEGHKPDTRGRKV